MLREANRSALIRLALGILGFAIMLTILVMAGSCATAPIGVPDAGHASAAVAEATEALTSLDCTNATTGAPATAEMERVRLALLEAGQTIRSQNESILQCRSEVEDLRNKAVIGSWVQWIAIGAALIFAIGYLLKRFADTFAGRVV